MPSNYPASANGVTAHSDATEDSRTITGNGGNFGAASVATYSSYSSASSLNDIPTAPMSTLALQNKLRLLRQESQKDSQLLTQKLATSQSGQNLLHIGTSLSTLPPDLHSLLTHLHPILSATEHAEAKQLQKLTQLVQAAQDIRLVIRRIQQASECADLYADLVAAETTLRQQQRLQHSSKESTVASGSRMIHFVNKRTELGNIGEFDAVDEGESDVILDNDESAVTAAQLDYALSLERAAHITLSLLNELRIATEFVSALTTSSVTGTGSFGLNGGEIGSALNCNIRSSADRIDSTLSATTLSTIATTTTTSGVSLPTLHSPLPPHPERGQFLMKLAPRIRRVESETARCLGLEMERLLTVIRQTREHLYQQQNERQTVEQDFGSNDANALAAEDDLLLMLGHYMRGLVLLGRGRDVETIFARVAIMPLIRSELSMGRLDEGGARGECAGLFRVLDTIAESIYQNFGSVLRLAEDMFSVNYPVTGEGGTQVSTMDVDLLTAGVWVPIATALMADAGIKMAIFSPGIASILQANYCALDTFLSELAMRLLKQNNSLEQTAVFKTNSALSSTVGTALPFNSSLMFRPSINFERIQEAQNRIYTHHQTAEFSKKWNLPIYYQLRFGDCCTRLNKAIDTTQREGWISNVFHGSSEEAERLKQAAGFELPLFLELYDIMLSFWRPDVILRPLTNRFLRGAVQLVGRVVAFVSEGMNGLIKFGEEERTVVNGGAIENGTESAPSSESVPSSLHPSQNSYSWGDNEGDVAAVAWEMTILDSVLRHDYADTVFLSVKTDDNSLPDTAEVRTLISEVLKEAAEQIYPIIDKAWNDIVVRILINKCSAPLAAVKGVAATYRMTNRPPPTHASPFVSTILRPLSEFIEEFQDRTPDRVGTRWKQQIVVAVADRYAASVDELIATVQRTEVALNNRRARRSATGGLRDGEKVKLQLYLDYQRFHQTIAGVGVEPATVIGLSKLRELTLEGEALMTRSDKETN